MKKKNAAKPGKPPYEPKARRKYFARKWLREHLAQVIISCLVFLTLVVLALVYRSRTLVIDVLIAALVLAMWNYHGLMNYLDANVQTKKK